MYATKEEINIKHLLTEMYLTSGGTGKKSFATRNTRGHSLMEEFSQLWSSLFASKFCYFFSLIPKNDVSKIFCEN